MESDRRAVLRRIGAVAAAGTLTDTVTATGTEPATATGATASEGQLTSATGRVSASSCPPATVPAQTDVFTSLADDPTYRRQVIETHTGVVADEYASRGLLPATDPYSAFDFGTYDSTRGILDLNDGFEGVSATGYVESDGGEPVAGGQEITLVMASTYSNGTLVVLAARPELDTGFGVTYDNGTTTASVGTDGLAGDEELTEGDELAAAGTSATALMHVDGAEPVKFRVDDPDDWIKRWDDLFDDLNPDGLEPPVDIPIGITSAVTSNGGGGGAGGPNDNTLDTHLSVDGQGVVSKTDMPADLDPSGIEERCQVIGLNCVCGY